MEEKEIIMIILNGLTDDDVNSFVFSQINIFGVEGISATFDDISIARTIIEKQLEFYEYMDIDYDFNLKVDPKTKIVTLIISLKPKREHPYPSEIHVEDYNTILNHIDLFDPKYLKIIQSDNCGHLSEFINYYCVCLNNNNGDEPISFLHFLENEYKVK